MNPRAKALRAEKKRRLEEAKRIAKTAESAGRNLTKEEKTVIETTLATVEAYDKELGSIEDVEQKTHRIDELLGTPPGNGASPLLEQFKSAGFVPRREPGSISFKAFTEATPLDDVDRGTRQEPPLPADRRWAFPAFAMTPVAAGQTSVEILKQTSRTLASASEMIRPLASVSEKPETSSERALSAVPLTQIATVSGPVPLIYVANGAADIIQTDMKLAFDAAVDAHVLEELYADGEISPAGADLSHSLFDAVELLAAEGYAANTVILNPSDATDLALTQTAGPEAMYQKPPVPDGLRIRISKDATDPIVADAGAAGRLFMSPVTLDSDSSGPLFTQNQIQYRLEANGLFVIFRPEAVAVIT